MFRLAPWADVALTWSAPHDRSRQKFDVLSRKPPGLEVVFQFLVQVHESRTYRRAARSARSAEVRPSRTTVVAATTRKKLNTSMLAA
jgi:hypothetical protein